MKMKNALLSFLALFLVSLVLAQPPAQNRTPLYEMFTSSTCAPCYNGNLALNEAQDESNGNWTCIKYQMYWPGDGDPYFTEEGYTRVRYYDVTGVPALFVDGNSVGLSSLNQEVMQNLEAVPAKVNLNAEYLQEDKAFTVNVKVEPTENVLTPFLKLFVAIIENKTYNNVESNGETEFEYVMKKMLPTGSGESIKPLKVDQVQEFEFNFEFQGEYRLPENANDPIDNSIEHSVEDFNDLSVVVWVQNRNTGEILQSTWATLPVHTKEVDALSNGIIALFPNPSSDALYLHYQIRTPSECHLSILDQNGRELLKQDLGQRSYGHYTEGLDVSGLEAGQYILQLQAGKELLTKKVVVIGE
jgi:hypothetical protein